MEKAYLYVYSQFDRHILKSLFPINIKYHPFLMFSSKRKFLVRYSFTLCSTLYKVHKRRRLKRLDTLPWHSAHSFYLFDKDNQKSFASCLSSCWKHNSIVPFVPYIGEGILNLALPYYLWLGIYYILVVCFETKHLCLKDADNIYLFITQWALFAAEKSETFNCLAHLPVKYTWQSRGYNFGSNYF